MASDYQAGPKEKEIVEHAYPPLARCTMWYCTRLFILAAICSFVFAIHLLLKEQFKLGIVTLVVGFPQAVGFALTFSFVSSRMAKCKTVRIVPIEGTETQTVQPTPIKETQKQIDGLSSIYAEKKTER